MKFISKKHLFLIITILINCTLKNHAQNINYAWTVAGGAAGIDDGRCVITDSLKNVYAVGSFTGSVDFDPGSGINTLTAIGTGSGYFTKYDTNGNLQWALPITGTVSASCTGLCNDKSDNIYIIGEINGTSGDFDPGTGISSITSLGLTDVYIAKYTNSGQFVWVQQFGGNLNEYARKIKSGKNDEIVITCNFQGTVDFDPGPGTNNITSAGSSDVFIARIYTNGVLDWVKTIGNVGNNEAPGIGVDKFGGIYSTGSFSGTLDTDPSATTTNFLTATGNSSDGVIIKLDSNGIFQWSHNIKSNSAALINDVEPDADNNIYLTGWYAGYVDFDPTSSFDSTTNISGIDAFIWKMNINGNHIWVKRTGNSLPEFYDGRSIKFDTNGNPYLLGIFEGSADFDPSAGINTLTSLGDFDIFVWGLYPNGNFLFCKSVGGQGKEVSSSLHIDNENNIYFTGFFNGQVDFNPWAGTNLISSASTFADFHISKWKSCIPDSSTIAQISCDSIFNYNGQDYTSSGTYTQTLTNVSGCDSIVTLQLTFLSIDTTTTLSGFTITSSQNGANYQWYNCDGNWSPLSNETQQSFIAQQNGQFAVIINFNGCIDTSSCISINGVGIDQTLENDLYTIFPNPTTGIVNFVRNSNLSNVNLFIYNSLGQLVEEIKLTGQEQTKINLQEPSGYYIIKITSNEIEMYSPLIIK